MQVYVSKQLLGSAGHTSLSHMSSADLARYPNLMKRGSRYYVRVRVPKDVVALEKREHITRSLNTSDYAKAVRKLPNEQPSLVLHSFRHGFRDACRAAGIPEETARALGGWAADNHAARYGGMVPVLNRPIRKLRFGGFQLRPGEPT